MLLNILKILGNNNLTQNELYFKSSDLYYELYILKCKNYKTERNDKLMESYRKNKKDINIPNNSNIAEKKIEDEDIKNDILFNAIKIDDLRPKKQVQRSSSAHMRILKVDKKLIDKNNLNLEGFLPKAIHKKSTPGVIGLSNIGATCYMNATLQCFSNIKGLRLNLLNRDIYVNLMENKKSTNKLSFALAEVLKNLWENNNIRFYAPEYFKKIISEMNPLFKGIAANDPKDLILFLLETMHKELNNPKNINIINNKNIDATNFVEVFNDFSNYYISKNKSIISDEFYGFNNTTTVCGFCQIPTFNVQSYNILFFPLEEVRNYKEYDFNSVNIYDCFDYYQKQDIYHSFHCNNCNKNYHAFQQSNLLSSPRTLIINLNRGKGIEFNINIIFEEFLNIKKHIIFRDSPYYYELIGVISHFGSNDMGGHFIAFCKNSNNCEWYKYNDQNVTKSSFNEITQSGLPYVLFYSYIKV